jgi:MATE family, multidrug efflux pump
MTSSDRLGTEKVQKLILNLGWPAAVNFLVASVYNITDAVFVGHWLGPLSIAAVVIGGTIGFLFSCFGLAIGIGGASIISRALGEKDKTKAANALANQLLLVVITSAVIVAVGYLLEAPILKAFGANGRIFTYASAYYRILLFGTPFFSLSLMGNNVIQGQGKAKRAMLNNLLPTSINLLLNPLFIKVLDMGIRGSAWATVSGYVLNAFLVIGFFASRSNEIPLRAASFRVNLRAMRETLEIGGLVFINVIATNVFFVLLNKFLFNYLQESGVILSAIVTRVCLLFMIPLAGLDGGVRPVIGYNFGSQQIDRVRTAVYSTIRYGITIGFVLLGVVFLAGGYLVRLFTDDPHIGGIALFAMKIVFSAFPLVIMEVTTVAYFQSIGKPRVALYVVILRYVALPVPLLYLLSYFFGYRGVLYAFPAMDILCTLPAFFFLRSELNARSHKRLLISQS